MQRFRYTMSDRDWLKKYTKLEYVIEIPRNRELHLGDPASWDDQNDAEAIRLYSKRRCNFSIKAICLTQASDRFHFWHIFGGRELGVCLWFDRKSLLQDIKQDVSLISDMVQYPPIKNLPRIRRDEIPFTKREQYRDECEFRVLRVKSAIGIAPDKLKFSPLSLRKIYLNPWLSPSSVDLHKRVFNQQLKSDFAHVELKQNRSLRMQKWIDALSASANNDH